MGIRDIAGGFDAGREIPKKINVTGIPDSYSSNYWHLQEVAENNYCRRPSTPNPDEGRYYATNVLHLLGELFRTGGIPSHPHVIQDEMQSAYNLGYDVFHRFTDYSEESSIYRFDLIVINRRSYLRFIRDDQASQDILDKRVAGLYGNLCPSETTTIDAKIIDILEEHSKNTLDILHNFLNVDKDKVLAAAKVLAATPKIDPVQTPKKAIPKPPSFYDNPYCISTLAEQYFVHVSELGLLIAL